MKLSEQTLKTSLEAVEAQIGQQLDATHVEGAAPKLDAIAPLFTAREELTAAVNGGGKKKSAGGLRGQKRTAAGE